MAKKIVVSISLKQGSKKLGGTELVLDDQFLAEELDRLAGKFGFVEVIKALAELAKLQTLPMPPDTSRMKLW